MLDERPLTVCPECTGELDLTFAVAGDVITCAVCGAECIVRSLDPPEVEIAAED
jgi:lysine biosynthesis protein LysW